MINKFDLGLNFENWICYELPKQLNLSASKETAVIKSFRNFADFIRQLEEESPKEFKIFYSEFIKRFEKVSKWRAPKGQRCIRGYGILRR